MSLNSRKLGKRPARIDSRTLTLAHYLPKAETLPAPPQVRDFTHIVAEWPMLLNDLLGDCVVAAALHSIQEWSAMTTPFRVTPNDDDALNVYELFGYDPKDPSTDQGIVMLDFLKYWRKTGLPVQGKTHKIDAFVSVNPKNPTEVAQALWLFGNLFVGVQLPLSAQNQAIWCVPDGLGSSAAPGSWGGHCVPIMREHLDSKFPDGIGVITWGEVLSATWYFLSCYCDEAYAILSPDWIGARGIAPNQFDLAQLQADLQALTAGGKP
jgi:hypothetical protein